MRVKSDRVNDNTRCKKLNNNIILKNITKHTYIYLPQNWTNDCVDKLVKISLDEILLTDSNEKVVTYNYDFFTLKRYILLIISIFDTNMSPVEGKIFSACLSMQNLQILTRYSSVNKYIYKYISKIDK